MAIWSIGDVVSLRYRPCIDGGGPPQYGGWEFTASHDPGVGGIAVEWLDPAPEVRRWFPDLIAGLEGFQAERSDEGRPVGAVRLAVTRVHWHPVDTNSALMRRLAREAIRRLFEQHGREIPDP